MYFIVAEPHVESSSQQPVPHSNVTATHSTINVTVAPPEQGTTPTNIHLLQNSTSSFCNSHNIFTLFFCKLVGGRSYGSPENAVSVIGINPLILTGYCYI